MSSPAAIAAAAGLRELKRSREAPPAPEMETDDEAEPVRAPDGVAMLAAAASAAASHEAPEAGEQKRGDNGRSPGDEAVEEVGENSAKVARVAAVSGRVGGADFPIPRWESLAPNPGVSVPDRQTRMVSIMDARDDFPYLRPTVVLEAAARGRLDRILAKQGRSWDTLTEAERLHLRGAMAEFVVEGMRRGFGSNAEHAAMREASGQPDGRTEARWQEIARDPEFAAPRSRLYRRDDGTLSGCPEGQLRVVNGQLPEDVEATPEEPEEHEE